LIVEAMLIVGIFHPRIFVGWGDPALNDRLLYVTTIEGISISNEGVSALRAAFPQN
jgi:hypothetical protein